MIGGVIGFLTSTLEFLRTKSLLAREVLIIMAETKNLMQVSLQHWMRDLPPKLKDYPLIYLAIPGSHDSMTYGITRSSELAPDAEPVLHRLYPLFRGTILRWTITQNLDATHQLHIGIRYFDLRVTTKTGTNDIFFTHGLYADEITMALQQIREFVDSHPGEVVLLDFQHFYNFTPEDHARLKRYLQNMYGSRLVPRTPDLPAITLNSLNRLKQQIIVIYRHQSVYASGDFWQPQMMPSPWPKQDKTRGLISFLENVKRHSGMGFVHQAVLTPTPSFILLRWASSLKEKCAVPVLEHVLPKLTDFSPGPPFVYHSYSPDNPGLDELNPKAPVNVVIADYVELNDAEFPKTIIELNVKLLENGFVGNNMNGYK